MIHTIATTVILFGLGLLTGFLVNLVRSNLPAIRAALRGDWRP